MAKIRVGIIFGGKSSEHRVSLQSAQNIIDAIDQQKFDISLIGIDQDGGWRILDTTHYLENGNDPKLISLAPRENSDQQHTSQSQIFEIENAQGLPKIDVVFPIIHGTLGEDGALQGMLKMLDLPFVGSDVLSSAVCMDKDVTKRLLQGSGIAVAPFLTVHSYNPYEISFQEVQNALGLPVFVKPANQGSSVGVSKVENEQEYLKALDYAFEYDNKVLIEKFIKGREIECGVLGNYYPKASVCGEVVVKSSFYSYEAKYIDNQSSEVVIPALISEEESKKLRDISIKAFKVLGCLGLARVDFFLTEKGEILLNEVNTLPGFTNNSMYPKLWENTGISYSELITQLLELALERHEHSTRNSKLI
ncbi:D-alanine--D-alanine ligase [Acinetobacter sp. P8-3-8]|uniref:D-alanine--D-alanine ligase n=1 Tax=Acinetobacter sp. P8-3-8 TaxID=1029823 RepID=UPI000248552C|nr:D-alanine--D-alanine ligase [Acinetobacter sp. P8-3-8]